MKPIIWLLFALSSRCVLSARTPTGTIDMEMQHKSMRSKSLTDAARKDRVYYLPGWGTLDDLEMYSGYVTVDQEAGRHLFYIHVESAEDPQDKPLLLWLNGGPGCSSVGGGFMAELGPFLPLPGGKKLQANPYSWHRVANVLFVESPAFVGFSYSETPGDAIVGDARTAADMRKFLLGFVERFPQYKDRELYISGESYAGHYLPTLAWEIVQGNKASTPHSAGWLNFKGLLLGNPWTDAAIDNAGAVDYWWAHAIVSDKTADGIKKTCDFRKIGPLEFDPTKTDLCNTFCYTASQELGNINIYQIYADVCIPAAAKRRLVAMQQALSSPARSAGGSVASSSSSRPSGLLGAMLAAEEGRMRNASRGSRVTDTDPDSAGPAPAYDPCVDGEVQTYMNLPEVQRALHANVSGDLPGPWTDCAGDRRLSYSREDLLSSMLPVWHNLIQEEGLRFLVYSGDVDGIVPVVGTRRWVAGLGLKEAAAWRTWSSTVQGQVGGRIIEYFLPNERQHSKQGHSTRLSQAQDFGNAVGDFIEGDLSGGFVFATVRGAGHMVPYCAPLRTMHMVSRFLAGQTL